MTDYPHFHLLCLVQGGLTATDVFAVEWIQTGIIHYGLTVSYYGFVSDGKPMQNMHMHARTHDFIFILNGMLMDDM